jgi:phosphinothricin acetyltransferase
MTTIRPACPLDAARICAIYNHYVDGTTISFEEAPVTAADMAGRIADVIDGGLPWLVLTDGDAIIGYAYATKWRARHAYRHAVESTIYLDAALAGQGHGMRLYASLLDALRTRALHTVIAGIAQPNARSRTRAVSACTNALALPRSRIFQKWASSSKCGSMWVTGRCA